MTKHERESRINKILSRLDQICQEDRALIQNRSSKPVTISVEHLFAYGERFDERTKLHDELKTLALGPNEG